MAIFKKKMPSVGTKSPEDQRDKLKTQVRKRRAFLNLKGCVFIDRGIFDNYAYARHSSLAGTETLRLINQELNGIQLNQRYAAIFLYFPTKMILFL